MCKFSMTIIVYTAPVRYVHSLLNTENWCPSYFWETWNAGFYKFTVGRGSHVEPYSIRDLPCWLITCWNIHWSQACTSSAISQFFSLQFRKWRLSKQSSSLARAQIHYRTPWEMNSEGIFSWQVSVKSDRYISLHARNQSFHVLFCRTFISSFLIPLIEINK